jgi:hypothetical protein
VQTLGAAFAREREKSAETDDRHASSAVATDLL